MNVYHLCKPGEHPIHEVSNPLGASHIVRVRGDADWYAARARALEHAAETGARRVLVLAGHVHPVRVLGITGRDRRSPGGLQPVRPDHLTDHALLLYVDRLLRQYAGAVLVPPFGMLRNMRAGWEEQLPSVAMCAGYSLAAALPADYRTARLEYSVVARGYRVITLSDYAYEQFGPTVLDTYGTQASWRRAYAEALEPFLG